MKKVLAIVLALAMVLCCFAACGGNSGNDTTTAAPTGETTAPVASTGIKVAMITDYGDITDQSFNQTTYEACKEYCEANGMEFSYFKPASDSDEERVAQIESAIDGGYTVIVTPGYAFANALKSTVADNAEVTFIALDVSAADFGADYVVPANLYSAVYQEELCGYMAGYAAVKLGYKALGFLGGMAVPAVIRYGYGFVQGIDAAAAELNLTDVTVKYAYGNQFFGDADITAAMDTWYADGVEVVFACGGGIYTSAVDAAKKVEGAKVIGVDVDQAAVIAKYAAGEGASDEDIAKYNDLTVTSAMKGLAPTVKTMLAAVKDGTFTGGKIDTLGLVSEVPADNYVQIAGSTQFAEGFTADDYAALVAKLFKGEITVSNDTTVKAENFATVIAVTDLGNIK